MASTYTQSQLEAYLQRIGYANSSSGEEFPRLHQLQLSIQQDPLKALEELQRRHISSIPWGNSAIHYSQHHSISTYPSAVFEKLVVRRLDGYCMENTNLLYVVLRSLGYQAYPAAGRVSSAAADPENAGSEVRYGSLGHMVVIVDIGDQKYMVDVGFGNNGPTSPLALLRNVSRDLIPPAQMKLDKKPLPEAVDQRQEFWVYSVRYGPDKEWAPMYAFTETEFLPQDFAMMNFNTSKGSSSWFTQRVVCVRHILGDNESSIKGLHLYQFHPAATSRGHFRSPQQAFPRFPAPSPRTMSTSIQEKLDNLQNYSACDKPADGSLPRAGHLADLTPFSPILGRNTTTPKIIAPASTIQFIPKSSSPTSLFSDSASPPNPNQTFPQGTHWVDNTEPNTIVLISQPPGQHCAVVGGIMAVRMKSLGIKGVVVDGRIRDLSEIQGASLPVWAKRTSTVGTGAEAKPGLRNVRIDVGGVTVEPGDIVFCDPLEGVVVIPKDLLDKVLEVMPGIVEADDKVKEAVEGGMSVFEAFKKFRG
ncbi:hypothetical protein BDW72DRAFT_203098 [Aspergillus terricola var. indicus]